MTLVVAKTREAAVRSFAEVKCVWNQGDYFRVAGDTNTYLVALEAAGERIVTGFFYRDEPHTWRIETVTSDPA